MLLIALDAFYTEHRSCRELDGGLDGPFVWFGCSCRAWIARRVSEDEA
jgi:hypothetical protein